VFYFDKKPNLFPHEQKVESLEQAQSLSKTRYFWIVHYLVDYTGFDFLYEPVPWESNHMHVWPSQWQEDSGTRLVPTDKFVEINYNHPSVYRKAGVPVYYIDHNNKDKPTVEYVRKVRYVDNYLDTLKRIVNTSEEEFIWVCSSVCNYANFDFSWHPSIYQMELLHVFASNEQKFGDTFFVNVKQARKTLHEVEILDWYSLNFVPNISATRHLPPLVQHNAPTHVQPVLDFNFDSPVTIFTDDVNMVLYPEGTIPTISLWRKEHKKLVSMSQGASAVLVPREAKQYIKTQLYDYPYIEKLALSSDFVLPIVFVDNGEPCAEENFEELCSSIKNYRKLKRIKGIKGRIQSQVAAANAVESDWYFFVPAKLKIDRNFDWSWQPDRLQAPKHYIFHAYNPVNELTYGHMAPVCYCKGLVLSTVGNTLDFTMESLHAVVPIVAGTATYNCDPKTAWRTAFREAIKLRHSLSIQPDIETEFRLEAWLEKDNGDNGKYSCLGAQAAVDYYYEVKGDYQELMITYEWDFVDKLFESTVGHLSLK